MNTSTNYVYRQVYNASSISKSTLQNVISGIVIMSSCSVDSHADQDAATITFGIRPATSNPLPDHELVQP